MNRSLFSSNSCEWSTPQYLFDQLNREFCFDLDPCANDLNHKCNKYFTINDDGLSQDWSNHTVFCNPPYGRLLPLWVKKCFFEHYNKGVTVVMLIPARTDTSYFHDYILVKSEIRFLKGRLKFGNSNTPAPFPSMLVIFR